jgi:UDP-glucose 4-epimerase
MAILVTGSRGLVGSALEKLLRRNFQVKGFDLRNDPQQDICQGVPLGGYQGVVHLAAVSRVVTGEHDPGTCVATNVDALRSLYAKAIEAPHRPWVVFVSSREVYGNATGMSVDEDAPFAPRNVYARTKVEGEQLSLQAREAGLTVNVARLSSVYGSVDDHADRVVPAFAAMAALGGTIPVEGGTHTLDFTHVDDVALGLEALVRETDRRQSLPPVHFVSGQGTRLDELAEMSKRLARARVDIVERPPRAYGVSHFIGDPARARELLGWTARIPLQQGLSRLVDAFAAARRVPKSAAR